MQSIYIALSMISILSYACWFLSILIVHPLILIFIEIDKKML